MFRNPVTDLLVVLVVVLLIFGPKRLPVLGRSLGQGLREFKDSISGNSRDEDEERPALNAAQSTSAAGDAGRVPVEASAPAPETPAQAAPAPAPQAPPAQPERESAEVGSSEQRV
jgi:sec-independent protein translocase protein TatA